MTELVAMRSRWHAFVERILPWFDPEAEAARDARTEEIRRSAIAARVNLERVRADYAAAAKRLAR